MSVVYRCDGCGRESPGVVSQYGCATAPPGWASREVRVGDRRSQQNTCGPACIKRAEENARAGRVPAGTQGG